MASPHPPGRCPVVLTSGTVGPARNSPRTPPAMTARLSISTVSATAPIIAGVRTIPTPPVRPARGERFRLLQHDFVATQPRGDIVAATWRRLGIAYACPWWQSRLGKPLIRWMPIPVKMASAKRTHGECQMISAAMQTTRRRLSCVLLATGLLMLPGPVDAGTRSSRFRRSSSQPWVIPARPPDRGGIVGSVARGSGPSGRTARRLRGIEG